MTGPQCAALCDDPDKTFEGQTCVAYEHASSDHGAVASCQLVYECDQMVQSDVLSTYKRKNLNAWSTRLDLLTDDAECPNSYCEDVDSLASCKRMCEAESHCTTINFRKTGFTNRCCVGKGSCDHTTADVSDDWDILERTNDVPRVVVDIITKVWENDDVTNQGCGNEHPNYVPVARWDSSGGDSMDTYGMTNNHWMYICVKYGEWKEARSEGYVTDLWVSSSASADGADWIGFTPVEHKDHEHSIAYSYRDRKQVTDQFNFFVQKSDPGVGNSPGVHYIPGVLGGGWSILNTGNGAGDTHTFTSSFLSTDEQSSHEEQTNAFSQTSTFEMGFTFDASFKDASGHGTFFQARYSSTEEKSREVRNTVANTITSSLENGQEVSCTFQAPDIGGAPYTTWVWNTARQTYDGEISELQTCMTHVKIGPCRDQMPNCVPGFCADQDCASCLTEDAILDTEFQLRPECSDETDLLRCHAAKFDGTDDFWNCCSSEDPCGQDEGDCDSDDDCKGDLVCVQDAGAGYGVTQYLDVCMTSRLHS